MTKEEIKSLILQNSFAEDIDLWAEYLYEIQEVFPYVKNKDVLEIGPMHGFHTKLMQYHKTNHVTMIEPATHLCTDLKKDFPKYKVHNDDIYMFLSTPKKFDVVVCFGVLYHLHSPIYLLELIRNRVDPDYIIMESTVGRLEKELEIKNKDVLFSEFERSEYFIKKGTYKQTVQNYGKWLRKRKVKRESHAAWYEIEEDNIPGNRYTLEWKSAGLNLQTTQYIFEIALRNLGYKQLYRKNLYGKVRHQSKQNCLVSVWGNKRLFKSTL